MFFDISCPTCETDFRGFRQWFRPKQLFPSPEKDAPKPWSALQPSHALRTLCAPLPQCSAREAGPSSHVSPGERTIRSAHVTKGPREVNRGNRRMSGPGGSSKRNPDFLGEEFAEKAETEANIRCVFSCFCFPYEITAKHMTWAWLTNMVLWFEAWLGLPWSLWFSDSSWPFA